MSKQSFTTGQVLTAAQVNSLQANDYNQTVSVKTASYVLVAADKGTRIEFNTSGSVTCTVNSGLFDAGDTLVIQNRGAGTATVTAGTATVNTSASLAISQYGQGILYFVDNTSAIFFAGAPGDITGVTTGATSGLTGGVTSGTADLKLNFASKGQLAVGTGSGTTDFLNVGTNGYTLVADSSTATGLAYAAPASSEGFTLLSTTTLSTTSTTISGISGSYKHLFVYGKGLGVATSPGALSFRFNSDTGNNYNKTSIRDLNQTLAGLEELSQDKIVINSRLQNGPSVNELGSHAIWIYRYTDTDHIDLYGTSYGHTGTGSETVYETLSGVYNCSAAITSITILTDTNGSGTIYLYGVK